MQCNDIEVKMRTLPVSTCIAASPGLSRKTQPRLVLQFLSVIQQQFEANEANLLVRLSTKKKAWWLSRRHLPVLSLKDDHA